jgi:squalene cyclase
VATDETIKQSCARALRYLCNHQAADGLWRDFRTLAGASSDWVSGFVAYAIASTNWEHPCVLAACKALLYRQRPNGGWSYNRSVPTDCDSTAWVLLALSMGPMWRPSAIQHGHRFLADHQVEPTAGFATYAPRDGIERFIELPAELTEGWRCAHPCVTAVTMHSLLVHGERPDSALIQNAAAYLETERDKNGTWRSYWWKGYAYSTYHALRALAMVTPGDRPDAHVTESFLLAEQRTDGGWNDSGGSESEAFATAFVVLTLLLGASDKAMTGAAKGVDWLIQHQRAEGDWMPSPILRIPPPMATDPGEIQFWRINQGGTGVIIADQLGLFTTAAGMWAMATFGAMTRRTCPVASAVPVGTCCSRPTHDL